MKKNLKKFAVGAIIVGTVFNVSIPKVKAYEYIDPPVLPNCISNISIEAKIDPPVLPGDINVYNVEIDPPVLP